MFRYLLLFVLVVIIAYCVFVARSLSVQQFMRGGNESIRSEPAHSELAHSEPAHNESLRDANLDISRQEKSEPVIYLSEAILANKIDPTDYISPNAENKDGGEDESEDPYVYLALQKDQKTIKPGTLAYKYYFYSVLYSVPISTFTLNRWAGVMACFDEGYPDAFEVFDADVTIGIFDKKDFTPAGTKYKAKNKAKAKIIDNINAMDFLMKSKARFRRFSELVSPDTDVAPRPERIAAQISAVNPWIMEELVEKHIPKEYKLINIARFINDGPPEGDHSKIVVFGHIPGVRFNCPHFYINTSFPLDFVARYSPQDEVAEHAFFVDNQDAIHTYWCQYTIQYIDVVAELLRSYMVIPRDIIHIVGLSGSGKTTICQKLNDCIDIDEYYDKCILSDVECIREITKKICDRKPRIIVGLTHLLLHVDRGFTIDIDAPTAYKRKQRRHGEIFCKNMDAILDELKSATTVDDINNAVRRIQREYKIYAPILGNIANIEPSFWDYNGYKRMPAEEIVTRIKQIEMDSPKIQNSI